MSGQEGDQAGSSRSQSDRTGRGYEWVQDRYEEEFSGGDSRNPTDPKSGTDKVLLSTSSIAEAAYHIVFRSHFIQ